MTIKLGEMSYNRLDQHDPKSRSTRVKHGTARTNRPSRGIYDRSNCFSYWLLRLLFLIRWSHHTPDSPCWPSNQITHRRLKLARTSPPRPPAALGCTRLAQLAPGWAVTKTFAWAGILRTEIAVQFPKPIRNYPEFRFISYLFPFVCSFLSHPNLAVARCAALRDRDGRPRIFRAKLVDSEHHRLVPDRHRSVGHPHYSRVTPTPRANRRIHRMRRRKWALLLRFLRRASDKAASRCQRLCRYILAGQSGQYRPTTAHCRTD